ncbi:ATP-dependent DNA helicase DDM1-like isoform X2 [Phragmites australis]|uniref:ATP-dependent DNA helicase DDM1-like isoform X2 n=1 Tax=Phragmites australis TaxID=29695 RepID=UPI002D78E6C2|nr:ATP-dependent DNA helicase DDM1-like isoform X2 [Phragmites australis]
MVEGMVVAVANGVKVEADAAAATTADSPKSVLEDKKTSEGKNGNSSLATDPIKQEVADDFVDASSSLPAEFEVNSGDVHPVIKAVKEEKQLLKPVKEEKADDFVEASSTIPIEVEANNGDASLITEAMKKEEEQLEEARIKAEDEEEARKREEAASLAFDPEARYNKLDELLTKTQLFSEFLFEKMDQITDEGVETQAEEPPVEEKKKGRGRKRKGNAAPQYNDKKARTAVAAMLTRSREDRHADDCTLSEEERWEKEQANLVPLLTGGKLKSYQIKGVKWLISLWQNGLNGILADQMGLGKTIQTIGFLAHLKGKGMHGPYLIIAPLSTLSNWVNEISRFTPSLASIIYHGDKVARAEIRRKFMPKNIGPDFPIVVTSYEMTMSDARLLAHYKWKYVVVDEGHRLKNSKCKLLREIKRIPMENKLLLTGTPLQNNLAELWSLLNFILPDIFSSHEEFESWFDFSAKGNEEEQEETKEKRRVHVVSKLHAILRPFLLRRMKEDVEQMLPRKKEIIIYANMTEHQKRIQDHLVEKTFDVYLNEESDIVLRRPGIKAKLNNLFIQLRKNCNHPDLLESAVGAISLYPPVNKLLEQCGKFQLLDRLLNSLLSRKHKVLIFSQWTKVLDIIEYYLDSKGLEACRIDGQVKLDERWRQIAEFNDPNSSLNIFILSTRAGGLGINLTSADTCILYDSDWNPQMDLQAMDRCHRIGQTRSVHVYRLATSHSVEGRMIRKAFGKLKLEHVVIGKGQFEQERAKPNVLDEAELLALLRDEQDEADRMIQTDISDEDLLKLMDRSDLSGPPVATDAAPLIPLKGPGWEVVVTTKSGGGMLSSLTS